MQRQETLGENRRELKHCQRLAVKPQVLPVHLLAKDFIFFIFIVHFIFYFSSLSNVSRSSSFSRSSSP
jgi:hypothetical protein